jgi:cytochrome c
MFKRLLLAILLVLALPLSRAEAPAPAFGVPLKPAQLKALDITVFPDGRNLPDGRGSVRAGRSLYAERCAMCHGASGVEGPSARLAGSDGFFAWSDPLRPLRILQYPRLMLSVGGQWPYASSIFDYVRRAMPHYAPKSLSDEEVYALTAFILHLNRLVEEDAELDRRSLPKVLLPGRQKLQIKLWFY